MTENVDIRQTTLWRRAAGALGLAMALFSPVRAEGLPIPLSNPGFELNELTTGLTINGLPNSVADWAGDASRIVPSENGITPHDGVQMLRFVSSLNPTGYNGISSDIWQLIDMAPYAASIAGGHARVTASAWFNRVAGNATTEPQFSISVRAFSGLPATFVSTADYPLADATAFLLSDSDPQTWEFLAAELLLPVETTYLGFRVAARETINDSPFADEFSGHYVDQTALELRAMPEPASLLLVGSGAIGLALRRRLRRGSRSS